VRSRVSSRRSHTVPSAPSTRADTGGRKSGACNALATSRGVGGFTGALPDDAGRRAWSSSSSATHASMRARVSGTGRYSYVRSKMTPAGGRRSVTRNCPRAALVATGRWTTA
jgi:hypothetical protein